MTRFFQKKTVYLLFWLGVVLLPVIEIYRSFFGHALQIFGIAVEEALLLLYWLAIFAAGLIYALKEKNFRTLSVSLGVSAMFFLYLIFHCLNAAKFNPALIPGAEPSFFKEAYYLVRMYFAPMALILSVPLFQIPGEKVFSALKAASIVISLGVIVPCLMGVSFASYADGNVMVDGGFFSWFSLEEGAAFGRYTTKGFFSDANAVGAILFGIFPFAAIGAIKKASWKNLAFVFLVGFAAIAVGTKIASLGFFLSSAALFAVGLLRILVKKEDRKKKLLSLFTFTLAVLLCIPLFLISPGKHLQDKREEEEESANRETNHIEKIENLVENSAEMEDLNKEDILSLEKYLAENHWDHFIDPWFLELYPVQTDPEFWLEVVFRENFSNADSRSFKIKMANRVLNRNNNPADPLLGIGHSAGIPYAERDFLGQYPLFGILGLLVLIAPYFLLLMGGAVCCIKALWKKKDLLVCAASTLAIASFLVAAYFAGHVFDTLFTTYFLAASSAALLSLRYQNDK